MNVGMGFSIPVKIIRFCNCMSGTIKKNYLKFLRIVRPNTHLMEQEK